MEGQYMILYPRLLYPKAEIDLFVVEKESRVEKSNLLQHISADDRVRSGNPVDLSLHFEDRPKCDLPDRRTLSAQTDAPDRTS